MDPRGNGERWRVQCQIALKFQDSARLMMVLVFGYKQRKVSEQYLRAVDSRGSSLDCDSKINNNAKKELGNSSMFLSILMKKSTYR